MDKAAVENLKAIVGKENVAEGTKGAIRFLKPGQEAPGLVVVKPDSDAQIQEIVNLARESKTGIITCPNRHLFPEDLDKKGILLDFARLNEIERIDKRNLVAHVQRGVTWEQLVAELKDQGVRAVAPVSANSEYVAECHSARVVGKASSKYWDYPMYNLRLVLPNGRIHKTGTHGFNEEAADGRTECGPTLSNWFVGSDDVYGIMTRATILLWPVYESRDCLVYAFDDLDELLTVMRDVPRTELGVEYLGINQASLQKILNSDAGDYPPWTLVVGFAGRSKIVEHNKKNLIKIMDNFKCKPVESLVEIMTEQLDFPWGEASDNHTVFYSLFSKLKAIDEEIEKKAADAGVSAENVGKIFTSFDMGRAVYAVYDLYTDDDKTAEMDSLNMSLADKGAFFSRPHGKLGRKIYESIPNHLPLLKHIKNIVDPDNIMNPGRIIKDEDKEWLPLGVEEGEIGLTISNLKKVQEKLVEVVGNEWVSNNPADLNCYSRDFTIFAGERPNLVVLPQSTEEVQEIIKIAYKHGIPVVPLSTGFNHGGLTITRKGGILVDLKRMGDTFSIDEEAMVATLSPGVRMRSVWWESVKRRAFDGYHLKPILPLTFGSVSLLSNYVSRGGAGTMFKYGHNNELTTGMKWVLPNGETYSVGAKYIPNVGELPIHFSPGPDLFGMFFNADGMFGICTELSAKLYPEKDNIEDLEVLINSANPADDHHHAFRMAVEAIHDIGQENITEFMYKAHPGLFALAMVNAFEGMTVKGVIGMSPQHPLGIMYSGYDAEEVELKKEVLAEILTKHGMFIIDPSSFGQEMEDMVTTDPIKKSLGIRDNFAGAYKGAFQWTACIMKMELIPEFMERFDQLVLKYWKTSDPSVTVEHAMTGTDIQGPLPLARTGGIEVDFWWDQGNPEDVKRATTMMHKTQKLMLEMGGSLFRNMFGAGEYHLPLWGENSEYLNLLKATKMAFDPDNLMHPDVLPVTDDYV